MRVTQRARPATARLTARPTARVIRRPKTRNRSVLPSLWSLFLSGYLTFLPHSLSSFLSLSLSVSLSHSLTLSLSLSGCLSLPSSLSCIPSFAISLPVLSPSFVSSLAVYLSLLLSHHLSLGAVSSSDVGHHGAPLFPASCSFYDINTTYMYQLAVALLLV